MSNVANNRVLNCMPSKNIENDYTLEDLRAASAHSSTDEFSTTILEEVDLREPWWKINEQKKTGSCVGWAVADSLLRWHFVKKGSLKNDELLSVRFIWMASKETDHLLDNKPSTFIELDGTSLKAALDVAKDYGCVKNSILPFYGCLEDSPIQYNNESCEIEPNNSLLYQGDSNCFYVMASYYKISRYVNLQKEKNSILEALMSEETKKINRIKRWKEWLTKGYGPIVVRLVPDDNWMKLTKDGQLKEYNKSKKTFGAHASAIVGYTKDAFIIRNSWGEDWGDKGFAYASYDYATDACTESYGVHI